MKTQLEIVQLIKTAIRNKYAWPGGYEIFAVMSDGAVLCTDCLKENFRTVMCSTKNKTRDGWQVVGIDCAQNLENREFVGENSEGYSLNTCEHCDKVLNP